MPTTTTTGVGTATEGADAFVPELWSTGIQNYIQKRLRWGGLCTDLSSLISNSGDTINIPAIAASSATTSTVTAFAGGNSAINYTETADATRTLTVNQLSYVGKIIPDVSKVQANPDMMTMYVQDMGHQIADAIDKHIFETFLNNTSTGVADTTNQTEVALDETSVFDKDDLKDLISTFYNNGIDPRDGYVFAVHPFIFKQLAVLDNFASWDYRAGANDFMATGSVGSLLGMPVYPDHRFTAYDSSGAPAGTDNLCLGLMWNPNNVFVAYSQKPSVMSQLSVDYLGTKMAVHSTYGAVVGNRSKVICLTQV